jgi:hypothetical protein
MYLFAINQELFLVRAEEHTFVSERITTFSRAGHVAGIHSGDPTWRDIYAGNLPCHQYHQEEEGISIAATPSLSQYEKLPGLHETPAWFGREIDSLQPAEVYPA